MDTNTAASTFVGSEVVAGCVIATVNGKRQYVYHSGKLTDLGQRLFDAMQTASPVPLDALEPGETLLPLPESAKPRAKRAYKPKG